METLLLLLTTVFGARTPVRGQALALTHKQQLDLLYLLRCGQDVEAIRRVREWKHASLVDALATVQALRSTGFLAADF